MKAILFSLALFVGALDHVIGGWAEPVTMAAAALTIPILLPQFRKLWGEGRFWITVSVLAMVQVPLVVVVHRLVEQANYRFYTLAFVILDGLFVIVVIFFVCSESSEEDSNQ